MKQKEKTCICWKIFIPRNSIYPCCSYECYEKQREIKAKEKKARSELKSGIVESIRKNTKRAFPENMKEEVMKRDGGCIICGDSDTMELHHIFYWGEAEYWPDRNDASKIVWLCKQHHHELHFEWGNNWREICKTYQLW